MGTTADTIYVSSAAELQSALASATAGTTILLASGNYGDLNLYSARQPWAQFAGEVTIKSADADTSRDVHVGGAERGQESHLRWGEVRLCVGRLVRRIGHTRFMLMARPISRSKTQSSMATWRMGSTQSLMAMAPDMECT